ncbi:hypothetical protein BD779DRAFT_1477438 [Infundibulicybe gibba]|nr:hypothetical protein BD779DRAFT_1477438 [Infundibulicybe gibba]
MAERRRSSVLQMAKMECHGDQSIIQLSVRRPRTAPVGRFIFVMWALLGVVVSDSYMVSAIAKAHSSGYGCMIQDNASQRFHTTSCNTHAHSMNTCATSSTSAWPAALPPTTYNTLVRVQLAPNLYGARAQTQLHGVAPPYAQVALAAQCCCDVPTIALSQSSYYVRAPDSSSHDQGLFSPHKAERATRVEYCQVVDQYFYIISFISYTLE